MDHIAYQLSRKCCSLLFLCLINEDVQWCFPGPLEDGVGRSFIQKHLAVQPTFPPEALLAFSQGPLGPSSSSCLASAPALYAVKAVSRPAVPLTEAVPCCLRPSGPLTKLPNLSEF